MTIDVGTLIGFMVLVPPVAFATGSWWGRTKAERRGVERVGELEGLVLRTRRQLMRSETEARVLADELERRFMVRARENGRGNGEGR